MDLIKTLNEALAHNEEYRVTVFLAIYNSGNLGWYDFHHRPYLIDGVKNEILIIPTYGKPYALPQSN